MSNREGIIPERTIIGGSGNEVTSSKISSAEHRLDGEKLAKFIELFERSHAKRPHCIIRAPGRVNLIGDHVDYHGFAVLPMAIANCIWLGCSFDRPGQSGSHEGKPADDGMAAKLELVNGDSVTYPSWTGTAQSVLTQADDLDKSHQWRNYVLCGYHGVLATDLLQTEAASVLEHSNQLQHDAQLLALDMEALRGVASCKMLIASDLPAASGLSSSSALVCASALATSLLLRESRKLSTGSDKLDSIRIAANCSKYENLVGTHGGGMDQAVIMTAQEGFAKYVEFSPEFSCENVRLPSDTVWLVSHCGVSYPKASTSGFNSRVLETKIGAALIAMAKATQDSPTINLDSTITLVRIRDEFYGGQSLKETIHDIRCNIFENRNTFTVDEVCKRLQLNREQLVERFKTSDRFLKEELNDELQVLNRCEHVLEEADRVNRFKSICDTTVDIAQLGQLMTQSHYSLRDKFECSHPALDKLVGVALDAGALGSRLTGAGWGGCIVSLVEASKRDTVIERLKEVSKFTFETGPHSGCEVYWL